MMIWGALSKLAPDIMQNQPQDVKLLGFTVKLPKILNWHGYPHKQHMSQVGPCASPFEKAQTYADQTTPFDSLFWDVPCSHITYRLEVCDHGAGCKEIFSFKKGCFLKFFLRIY